ncbi:MAG: hypothetical protein ACK4NS_13530 [Saprospiraceae bacterium]
MLRNCFWIAISAFLGVSCSPRLSVMTDRLYRDQRFSDNDLRKIQFYLSEDIVLYRDALAESEGEIRDGEIRLRRSSKAERIVIRSGTPGVFLFRPKDDHLAISFEEGGDKKNPRFLVFGPNAKNGGQYMLLAKKWERSGATVTYGGQQYSLSSQVVPRLMVSLRQTNKSAIKTRTARGRRI